MRPFVGFPFLTASTSFFFNIFTEEKKKEEEVEGPRRDSSSSFMSLYTERGGGLPRSCPFFLLLLLPKTSSQCDPYQFPRRRLSTLLLPLHVVKFHFCRQTQNFHRKKKNQPLFFSVYNCAREREDHIKIGKTGGGVDGSSHSELDRLAVDRCIGIFLI